MYTIKNEIINAFKKGVFPYIDGFHVEKDTDEDTDEDTDQVTDEEIDTTDMSELESEESAVKKKKSTRKRSKNINIKPNA